MSTSKDYIALRGLQASPGYQILQALWLQQVSRIEEGRDKAAAKGSETAWRYWAGQEKGFKLAMTALERAMLQMEREEQELQDAPESDRILEELRLKKETQ